MFVASRGSKHNILYKIGSVLSLYLKRTFHGEETGEFHGVAKSGTWLSG